MIFKYFELIENFDDAKEMYYSMILIQCYYQCSLTCLHHYVQVIFKYLCCYRPDKTCVVYFDQLVSACAAIISFSRWYVLAIGGSNPAWGMIPAVITH